MLLLPPLSAPHNSRRRLLYNDSLNHLFCLLAALLRSTHGRDPVHLTGGGLRGYLDPSVRRALQVPNDTTLSPNAEPDILIWNLKSKSEKGRNRMASFVKHWEPGYHNCVLTGT
jgi:hypothetical protein